MFDLMIPLAATFGTQLPLMVVYIAGIVLALTRKDLHPRTSTLVLVAFLLLLVSLFLFTPLALLLPFFAFPRGATPQFIGFASAIIGFLRALMTTAAFVLLLIAIFSRPEEARR